MSSRPILLAALTVFVIAFCSLQTWPVFGQEFDSATGEDRPDVWSVYLPVIPEREIEVQTPLASTRFPALNLFAEPQVSLQITGEIVRGESCVIENRNREGTWWLIDCGGGGVGWIPVQLISLEGDTAQVPVAGTQNLSVEPTVTPTPSPTPTPARPPISTDAWVASFHRGRDTEGPILATEYYSDVNFDWGDNAPLFGVPSDGFSARFERRFNLRRGYYTIRARADDGVRVWLNGVRIIDEWHGATGRTYAVGRQLDEGSHDFRVDFLELGGVAQLRFTLDYITDTPDWNAEYYANPNLAGNPITSRKEPRDQRPLERDWSIQLPLSDSPAEGGWSAAWEGSFKFQRGNYAFHAEVNGGVRVYIDDLLVIDGWTGGRKSMRNNFYGVGTGEHVVKIEYYTRSEEGSLRVWWYRDASLEFDG